MDDGLKRKQAAIDELVALLRPDRRSDGWVVRIPDSRGPVVFGGIGLAITIAAACREAPEARRLHSLHASFLRPVRTGEVDFGLEVVKAGRTVTVHRVTASQDDRPVIVMNCSFVADTDGYAYDLSGIPADVPPPESLPELEPDLDGDDGAWPWDDRFLPPSPIRPDGTREATHRHWFRLPTALDDDVHLHTALLGFATDWTGVGGRPLRLDGDTTGMVSLDHSAWFHRPARVDEWLLQDVHSLVNAGGRGTLRGVIRNRDGLIVASMAQEMLLSVGETGKAT